MKTEILRKKGQTLLSHPHLSDQRNESWNESVLESYKNRLRVCLYSSIGKRCDIEGGHFICFNILDEKYLKPKKIVYAPLNLYWK